MNVKSKLKELKEWAYETPTYDSPVWDKVDNAIDNGFEAVVNTKVFTKFVYYVDKALTKINSCPNPKWLEDWAKS